jgi:hypothetical protein
MFVDYLAAAIGNKVLSYAHYWYDVPAFSPEFEHRDDTILATLRVKNVGTACPPSILAQATGHAGTCLQTSVLGAGVVEDCGRTLESRGWTRENAGARSTGGGESKGLVCYRAPRP